MRFKGYRSGLHEVFKKPTRELGAREKMPR